VVVTGTHWITDAMLGAVVAGLSALGALQLSRAWPDAWAWNSRPVEVEATA
jgi:membrane-associated phospholipid phosphatase